MTRMAMRAYADAEVTITTTAQDLLDVGFTQSQIDDADDVHMTAKDGNIYYRYTGGAATSANAHLLNNGNETHIYGTINASQLSLLRNGAADVKVFITLSKY